MLNYDCNEKRDTFDLLADTKTFRIGSEKYEIWKKFLKIIQTFCFLFYIYWLFSLLNNSIIER